MSRPLPRFTDTAVEDERQLAKVLRETGMMARPSVSLADASAQELRGIPAIGRGVAGVSPGMDPFARAARREELGWPRDDVFDAACRMDWLRGA